MNTRSAKAGSSRRKRSLALQAKLLQGPLTRRLSFGVSDFGARRGNQPLQMTLPESGPPTGICKSSQVCDSTELLKKCPTPKPSEGCSVGCAPSEWCPPPTCKAPSPC